MDKADTDLFFSEGYKHCYGENRQPLILITGTAQGTVGIFYDTHKLDHPKVIRALKECIRTVEMGASAEKKAMREAKIIDPEKGKLIKLD